MLDCQLESGEPARADALLEETWSARGRAVRGRELALELAVTAAFLTAAGALLALAPAAGPVHPLAAAVVVAYAVAAWATFPLGSGGVVPTQLFLIPMFALAPAQAVPLLVFAGLALSTAGAAVAGRARPSRLVFCGGDALHALGPALALVLLADGRFADAGPVVLIAALAAQFAFDFASSALHDALVFGTRPEVHVRVLLQVWGVDTALAFVGLLAANATQAMPWAAMAPLPFVALLWAMAVDRSRRVDEAHGRLRALQRERARLRDAWQRVGDAFGSNLDLDALLAIVTRAAVEALDGVDPTAFAPGSATARALALAEHGARSRPGACAAVELDGIHAIARLIGGWPDPVGVVSVARDRPFADEEHEVLAHLGEQAALSAANAVRHQSLQEGEARLRHQAYHDPLSGLANRALFTDRVDDALRRHSRRPERVAVLFFDLDGFKLVNDTLGHDAGDELLVALAGRLMGCLRAADTPARFGGDEFAVLLEGVGDAEQAQDVARRLLVALAEPVQLADRQAVVGASVGLALGAAGVDRDGLLRRADLAMYAAKEDGGGRVVTFVPEMLARANMRKALATDLRGAGDRGELELRFQPVVSLGDGSVCAAEALVRWRHPGRGLLGPGQFIGLAEQTGAIDEITRFVIDDACRVVAGWPEEMVRSVSVNVSAGQLRDPGFAAEVEAAVRRHELPPGRLALEVTESVLVEPDAQTLDTLHALREIGVTLALDDFGTGYSSLSYLTQFPVDVLKLDRTFLAGIDEQPARARLVEGVIRLGQSLGLRVVVEGIETETQLAQLRDLGADLGQGYLFGVPMTAAELEARMGHVADDLPAALTAVS